LETRGFFFQGACYVLVFLTCVWLFAKVRSRRTRQITLLALSFALYLTWTPWFVAVLATSIIVNFLFGKWLRRNPNWLPLSAGVIFNLTLLGAFKYLPELAVRVSSDGLRTFRDLALPLGLSFWTFQAMSYLFDLYSEEQLDPSLIEFALYMAFFPVTISGPVCRMREMLPQYPQLKPLRTRPISVAVGFRFGIRRALPVVGSIGTLFSVVRFADGQQRISALRAKERHEIE
jgi:alginate O-acetyltransferase complex protein AlgI